MKRIISFLSFPFLTLNVLHAQDGTLDPTFGIGGLVYPNYNVFGISPVEPGKQIALQTDGKILITGYSGTGVNTGSFTIGRFNSNGSIDNSFGSNGLRVLPIGPRSDVPNSVVLDNSGRILICGGIQTASGYDIGVIRLLPDGQPDNTFGTNGVVRSNFGYPSQDAYYLLVQPDGKIVVCGDVGSSYPFWDFLIIRYNTNGTFDSSFGTNGYTITDLGRGDDLISIALQADGKIVGTGNSSNFPVYNVAVVRYNSNGSLDASFGNAGKVITDFGMARNVSFSVKIQADNKIIIGGSTGAGYSYFALRRFNTNGTVDPGFGNNSIQITDIGNGDDLIYGLDIQNDGKIIAVGYSGNNSIYSFALVRYNINGIPDPQFGNNGVVTTLFPGNNAKGLSCLLQPDDKIVVAGTLPNCGLARYNLKTIPSCTAAVQLNVTSTPPYCSATGVYLSATGSGISGASGYSWTLPDGSTRSGNLLTAYTSGKYYVRYHTVPDTCGKNDSITLIITKSLINNIGSDKEFCAGDQILLKPSDTTGIRSYLWQDGTNTKQYLATQPGLYWLEISNICGSATDTVMIFSRPGGCDCKLEIPNAFTPNSDGINDIYSPLSNCILTGEMKIFNRWGQLIYRTNDFNKGWNGIYKQKKQASGIYVYLIQYKFPNNNTQFTKSGALTLIR